MIGDIDPILELEGVPEANGCCDFESVRRMVTLASVVLVRAEDECVKALDSARHNAQPDPYSGGSQPEPAGCPHLPGAVQYDVEAPGVQADARLRFPHVGMNCHPVGMAADATSYQSPQQHAPKFARSERKR